MQLPADYIEEMKLLLKDDYSSYETSLQQTSKYGLRVNISKITVADFLEIAPFKLSPIPWIDNGFFYDPNDNVSKHPYYFAGLYYIQEPSAMTPASRLPITPGDKVLDMCAAPGGKATELGTKLRGEGILLANDISNSRAKPLLKNLELFGLANICVTSESPEKLATIYPEYFDKILIDAPCSGEGMFRREPRMIADWRLKGPLYYSPIQKELIVLAAKMLKPGGQMLYSTCTFSKQENEAVIAHLLATCQDMQMMAIEPYSGFAKGFDEYPNCVRIFPHKMAGEGHFMALLEKRGTQIIDKQVHHNNLKSDSLPAEATAFLVQVGLDFTNGYFKIINNYLYFIPLGYAINKGLRYLRSGLAIGELKKKRFEPSQALAMALKATEFKSVINLKAKDIRTVKYLKGETIDVSDCKPNCESGWQLVCVDNYPLGFGKLQNHILKNKYYSGWRMN